DDSRVQPGQSADAVRAREVRADDLRRHPRAHDDLPASGHPPRPTASARAAMSHPVAIPRRATALVQAERADAPWDSPTGRVRAMPGEPEGGVAPFAPLTGGPCRGPQQDR